MHVHTLLKSSKRFQWGSVRYVRRGAFYFLLAFSIFSQWFLAYPPRGRVSERVAGPRQEGSALGRQWPTGCIARSGKLDKARSRLYRRQILQENMRLNSYLVWELSPRSTQFTPLHSSKITFFQKLLEFCQTFTNFCKIKQDDIV